LGKKQLPYFRLSFLRKILDALPSGLLTKPLEPNAKIDLHHKDSVAINSLNLLGFRLRACESCTLSVTGWADKSSRLETAELAARRAENIKKYLRFDVSNSCKPHPHTIGRTCRYGNYSKVQRAARESGFSV
jgi:hypothetical protein